jgi:hypothetical protein
MARIRSIHPGFWTDETLASLSDAAALFYIGLLNEADDNGVFEWKPLTLRMRLRPTKDGSVEALLAELAGQNVICRYELDGRQYGAVRNFCRYQKPKFPRAVHPVSEAIAAYVGSRRAIPERSGDDGGLFRANAETAAPREGEREEGAGAEPERREGLRRGGPPGLPAAPPPAGDARGTAWAAALEAECRAAAGLAASGDPQLADLSPVLTLIAQGYDLARDILPKLRAAKAAKRRGRTWAYYVPAIVEGRAANARIAPKPDAAAAPMTWVLRDSAEWARRPPPARRFGRARSPR